MNNLPPQVDLTNCDREPIHILGAIQPIGFLIAVTTDWIVTRASENVSDFIGCQAKDMIGCPLAEYLPSHALHDLRNRVSLLRGPDSIERLFAREFGQSPARVYDRLRLEDARQDVLNARRDLTAIALDYGFAPASFARPTRP